MKKLVEDLLYIDIKDIKELLAKSEGKHKIELTISNKYTQEVDITSTIGNFGGFVYWFICPGCKRRVKKVYLFQDENIFICRHCHHLAYRTQNLRDFRKTKYIKEIKKEDIFKKRIKKRMDILKELEKMLQKVDLLGLQKFTF